jgi:hypothetical protein
VSPEDLVALAGALLEDDSDDRVRPGPLLEALAAWQGQVQRAADMRDGPQAGCAPENLRAVYGELTWGDLRRYLGLWALGDRG